MTPIAIEMTVKRKLVAAVQTMGQEGGATAETVTALALATIALWMIERAIPVVDCTNER